MAKTARKSPAKLAKDLTKTLTKDLSEITKDLPKTFTRDLPQKITRELTARLAPKPIDNLNLGSLRIGLFTDTYAPQVNGVSISLQLIFDGLQKRGHQVTVFAPRFPGYKDHEPGVVRLPSLKYLNDPPIYVAVLGTPRSTWSLSRKHFDVLHAHSPLTVGLLAYLTASTKSLPLIYTYHTSITDYTHYVKFIGGTSVIRHAARWFSAASTNMIGDQIVVPSPKIERLLLEQQVKKPIHVIPNGIDLSNFKTSPKPGGLRKRLGIAPEDPVLMSVGRVAPEKRLDFLIDVFVKIADQFPRAHLVFGGDGSALNDLKHHAAQTSVKDRIHFLGMVPRENLPEVLHDSTVFLSASTTETQGIAMLEGVAAGLPVVAVRDDAFEGFFEDGGNGYIVPLDRDLFAQKLADLLRDPAAMQRFSKRSLELCDKFSIDTQVLSLEKLYMEAILQNWRGGLISRRLEEIPGRISRNINKLLPRRSEDE